MINTTKLIPLHFLDNGFDARFRGTEWAEKIKKYNVMIAGLGGIGSHTAYTIGRLSPNIIEIVDDDIVNNVNLSGQLFPLKSIGNKKTAEVYNLLKNYCDDFIRIYVSGSTYGRSNILQILSDGACSLKFLITGFDNMNARKKVYEDFISYSKNYPIILIDGRMTIDCCQVICLDSTDKSTFSQNCERYQNQFLFEDSEAESDICSAKQTTYMGTMIASIIANMIVRKAQDKKLPIYTEYNSNDLTFRVEYE